MKKATKKRKEWKLPRLKPRNDKVAVYRHILDSLQQIFIYLFLKNYLTAKLITKIDFRKDNGTKN